MSVLTIEGGLGRKGWFANWIWRKLMIVSTGISFFRCEDKKDLRTVG